MERRRWLKVVILICLFVLSTGREHKVNNKHTLPNYNHTLARTLVEYSSATRVRVSDVDTNLSVGHVKSKNRGYASMDPNLDTGAGIRILDLIDRPLHQTDQTRSNSIAQRRSRKRKLHRAEKKKKKATMVYMSDLTELFTWTCSRCDGLTKGFEIIELIVDVQHCLQAFVGVAKDLNAIVIAFRGTQERSLQNWIEDLYWKQLDCNYPGVSDAMVHHGFYSAYHNTTLRPGILNAIESAKELYGDLQIMVTGHSMGGAMASFCGLDLMVNFGVKNVQVMTFGQPRIGNAAFASYYSQLVPNTIRITNEHDMVPHLPPYYFHFPQKTYHHFPREVWLYHIGFGSLVYNVEKLCDGSGEDPTCSRSVSGNSISDHLNYYGVKMGCDAVVSCKILMDPRVAAYDTKDQNGNFILSRDRSNSVLKMNSGSSVQSTAI